jgi:predicted RNA-binding Zn-ribbon protein involved in translation (DUF1610 family)
MKENKNNNELENININLKDSTEIVCSECGNKTFIQSFMIRKISAIESPTGEETIVPIPVFECSQCGFLDSYFIPKL